MNTQNRMNATYWMVFTALITAMTTLATLFFKFPIGNGYIHLGDTFVLLGAMVLPRKQALFAGSVGACLADVLSGYAVWAPWSFGIKLFVVIIMEVALQRASRASEDSIHILHIPIAEFVGFVLSGIWTVAAYYAAEGLIYGNWITPLAGAPFNAIQVGVGAVLAVILSQILYRIASSTSFSYRRK